MREVLRRVLAGLLLFGFADAARSNEPDAVDFNRDIRPILSNRCYKCHGPDENERKGGLRLDTRDGLFAETDSGARAIVPGNLDESELVYRIQSDDPLDRMPPGDEPLTEKEIDLLNRWVEQDAPFAGHWAYTPPQRPDPPAFSDEKWNDWVRTDIDRFVLNRMLQQGLEPAEEADRETLLRRVTLDLTGLPPTLEDRERFLSDTEPGAYDRLVDRLLKSPAYGEHWARLWLDLARYADSAGYADDPPRTIWPYRDWVIQAMNANLPFDQFTIEQIAGDLLPNPSRDQLIATAFHRNTLTNNEGGTDDEEFRNVAVVDRVNTTMAVWMGTTMSCAQCHTHKYDPITQEEYFRFFAFFNNTEDADRTNEAPILELWTPEQEQQKATWTAEANDLERVVSTLTDPLRDAQRAWEDQIRQAPPWTAMAPASVQLELGGEAQIRDDASIFVPEGRRIDTTTVQIPVSGRVAALQLETVPDAALPGGGAGHGGGNFVITGIKLRRGDAEIKLAEAFADFSQDGFDAQNVLDEDMPTPSGWAVAPRIDKPHTLTLVLAEPVTLDGPETLTLVIEQHSPHTNHTLGRFRLFAAPEPSSIKAPRTPAEIRALIDKPADERTPEESDRLGKHFLSITPELETQRARLAELKKSLADLRPASTVPIMRDKPETERRTTRIHNRGNFLDQGTEVTEGVPAAFPPLPEGMPTNRLALAYWLVDDANPLTARVVANRFWETLFGRGIVLTSEDFGAQGEAPSHPELLDWLATELTRLDWDQKAFLRLLVTSSVYRQSSRVQPETEAADPGNVYLARGPRFRMSAEMIRDQALAISGLLSSKMFGEPVKPPQPKMGLNAAFGGGIDWQTSTGADRYRRGIYTTWRRSNPYPSMTTFDAPNREVCTIRRDRTNTPLQALVTLNDPVYVEAAQALARRMTEAGPSVEARARRGFLICLSREPSSEEIDAIARLHERALAAYREQPELAAKMATEPLGPAPEGADLPDLAAWTVVGNVLLNLDETLMKK